MHFTDLPIDKLLKECFPGVVAPTLENLDEVLAVLDTGDLAAILDLCAAGEAGNLSWRHDHIRRCFKMRWKRAFMAWPREAVESAREEALARFKELNHGRVPERPAEREIVACKAYAALYVLNKHSHRKDRA